MLILCEKPSVAKEFAALFKAGHRKGYYQAGETTVTYCVGHLYELLPPEGYDPKYKKWTLEDLPVIPSKFSYRESYSTSEQAEIVAGLLKKHKGDDVLIATDAGREGELIARIAMLMAGISDSGRFRRFWVSEALTPSVIEAGIRDAKPLSEYDLLAAQGFARQRADWLVGINLTRLMSIGSPPPPMSVGRVQTAVLAAVASRNSEVKNFVAVPYKKLEASVESKDGVAIKAYLENPRLGNASFFESDWPYVHAAVEDCKNNIFGIDSVDATSKEKKIKPPKLLNITALQKEAFRRHGLKPEETLEIAQALYETHKCLSYPRTPSKVMGDNNVELFLEKFNLLRLDSSLSCFSDPSLIAADNKHIFNSAQLEDHHALIPLAKIPPSANEKEHKIYSIVLESFFIACMPDYVCNEKTLQFRVSKYLFSSKIRETVRKGWKEVVQEQKSDDESEEEEVPVFDESNCSILNIRMLDRLTKPNKEFAIDTLLAFMEHPRSSGDESIKLAGLGTPATRAEIIRKLFASEYLREEKKSLYATDRGLFLLGALSKSEHLKKTADVAQTTEWESSLAADPKAFEREVAEYVALCVKGANAGPERETFRQASLGSCPLCKRPVYETKIGYGCSGYKETPKCSFIIFKTIAGASVSAADASLLLMGQKTKPKKCKGKEGKPFEASFALEGGNVKFLFKDKK
jgi:DNA topoisomerase III